ncbi:MAG TPA: hypothetical protein VFB36_08045 [Nevskiaceae bacterium]|nr:hypothetical protein [Nevskiaceae bacterium]
MAKQEEDRGPGARKTRLEKRLNANADAVDEAGVGDEVLSGQQATARGHKGQLAQPHRSGRPSGGNIRTRE